jgi:thiamine biosynthesis lipoprotein
VDADEGPEAEAGCLVEHIEEEVMGTVVTIDLYGDAATKSESVTPHLARAIASLHEADALFSTWKSGSPLSRFRRGDLNLDDAPSELSDVLSACESARALSRGWFDPWALPGGVDPTGFVKGWAAQRALGELLAAPLGGAIINAAGDIATFGSPSPGTSFKVGITNPDSSAELVAVVELRGCIATSGTYERGAHLMDPHSGIFCTRLASASVTGPDLGLCDALATALVVAGNDLLGEIETMSEFEAFTIAFDSERRWTSGFALSALARGTDR